MSWRGDTKLRSVSYHSVCLGAWETDGFDFSEAKIMIDHLEREKEAGGKQGGGRKSGKIMTYF